MANYNLVIDSKATPYDYASALVPIFTRYGERYDKAYEKAEQQYLDNLDIKSIITNETDDTELSLLYNKYEEEFNIGIIINRNRKYCTFWQKAKNIMMYDYKAELCHDVSCYEI